MSAERCASAWEITADQHPLRGKWRAVVLQRTEDVSGLRAWEIVWRSERVYASRGAAQRAAKAHMETMP